MRNLMLGLLIVVVYALHHDVWFWDHAHPLLFGVLPIGLAYHVLYSIVVAGLMWLLVRYTWPALLALSEVEGSGVEGSENEGPGEIDASRLEDRR